MLSVLWVHTLEENCWSFDSLMFNILRSCQNVFQKDCILHSHQQCMRVTVSPFYSHLSQLDSVKLFPSFLTEAAFDKVVVYNIKVPEFKVRCQSSLCLTYKQHLTQMITHFSLVHFFFTFGFQNTTHSYLPPPTPILLVSPSQFLLLFSSFSLLFRIGVSPGDCISTSIF